MADRLQRGASWLAGKLQDVAAQTVTYSRGATSVSVPATLGSTLLKLGIETGGVRIERTDKDFMIAAADLGLTPQAKDRIQLSSQVYEVRSIGNEPAWRWSDPHRTILRIHTKLIAE